MINFLKSWINKENDRLIDVVNTAIKKDNKCKLVRGFEGWLQYELAMTLRGEDLLEDIEPRLEKKDGGYIWADLKIKNSAYIDLAVFDKSDRNSLEKDYVERYKNIINNKEVFIIAFYFYDNIDQAQYNYFVQKNKLTEVAGIENNKKGWSLKILYNKISPNIEGCIKR